ncbi:MAG TPA: hypothetical protein EYP14_11910, partial [Planctomycetaceae bacterium]|nr:hypothetical protein [Planctomycetaceae bacterium]
MVYSSIAGGTHAVGRWRKAMFCREIASVLVMAVVFLQAGCGGEGSYRLRVVFPDEAVREATERLEVLAFDAGLVDCDALMGGEQVPVHVKSAVALDRPFEGGKLLRQVGVGPTVFFAEGEGLGVVLLRGCAVAEVKAGARVDVEILLRCVCNPGSGGCAPSEEEIGNGIDDDCDGETDECTSDADCSDGNECTVDSCDGGMCANRPVADGTACTDDGVFCNGPESCAGGVCVHGGDPCAGADGDSNCAESCDEAADDCRGADPDGSACDDGAWCTVGDACMGGLCVGTARD